MPRMYSRDAPTLQDRCTAAVQWHDLARRHEVKIMKAAENMSFSATEKLGSLEEYESG